jgi:osmotically-inducible protein OsmY
MIASKEMFAVQPKSSYQIMHEVLRELRRDSRIGWWDTQCINVTVRDGVVTLTGYAASYAKKVAAQEAARRVAGVLDVINDIGLGLTPERDDTQVAQAVHRV